MVIKDWLIGLIAFVFFTLSCSYSLLKRIKIHKVNKALNRKKLLDGHCLFAIISTILAIIHVGSNIYKIKFSAGYICLFSMLLITASGIVMKYSKILYLKYKNFWISVHITLTIIFILSILFHIITYIMLS
ncbi:hypothetical protein [Clostridium sp. DJ247]|uniref:hypothetical protein n=1 Tax=Clostridium sp. DJ247 TaxID=2726188 RepID=UPI001629FD28|nr:hypothetical protein [Clostridium sp. DJ247]MBC2578808.1 hypothetical protein [Clostridium sp. DJ247]